MSYGKKTMSKTKKSLFCSWCDNAGNCELAKTHNFRDATGKPCCPTLAATKCKYCEELGHTVKHCQMKKCSDKFDADMAYRQAQRKKREEREEKEANKSAAVKAPTNIFAALEESESEAESPRSKSANVTLRPHQRRPSFDDFDDAESVLSAISEDFVPKLATPTMMNGKMAATGATARIMTNPFTYTKGRCWADIESSDDEEDEEPAARLESLLYKYEDACVNNAERWR